MSATTNFQTADASVHLQVCSQCDSVVEVPVLQRAETASCPQCGHVMQRFQGWSPKQLLAICATAWILLLHVLYYPLVTLEMFGSKQNTSIWESVLFAWGAGHWAVGWMTFLNAILLPITELAVITSALWCVAIGAGRKFLVWALRAVEVARSWNMLAVFLLGVLVALIKLSSMGALDFGVGLFSLGCLVLVLGVLQRVDAHTLWRMAEERGLVVRSALTPQMLAQNPHWQEHYMVCHHCGMVHSRPEQVQGIPACVRCGRSMFERKRHSLRRCWALLLTALVFYIPANLLPIMSTGKLQQPDIEHTILSGVVDLYTDGSPGIAVVVFVASLAVPVLKFIVMLWLLLSIQWRAFDDVRERAWLFRVMEFIGQWSMLDVFVVILLAALVHFEGLARVQIGTAAWSFGTMVIFTMLAAQQFDPRLLWDKHAQHTLEKSS